MFVSYNRKTQCQEINLPFKLKNRDVENTSPSIYSAVDRGSRRKKQTHKQNFENMMDCTLT